jgi:hypothetical protein
MNTTKKTLENVLKIIDIRIRFLSGLKSFRVEKAIAVLMKAEIELWIKNIK